MRLLAFVICMSIGMEGLLAQQTPKKPKELETIAQYAGDWTTEVTSRPAEWNPHEIKYRCMGHAEFVLDGWYMQQQEVNHIVGEPDQVTKSIWFQAFDMASSKYVIWTFQSSGNMVKAIGTWDAVNNSFLHTDTDGPPNTTNRFSERFRDAVTIDGSIEFTSNDGGRKLFDMVWTRKRPAVLGGKPFAEQWAAIGTPIQPIPDEVKKLEMFVGTRDVEFINRPSLTSPQGSTAKGTMSGRWILDGRFLMGETKLPTFQSLWIMGYDTNKQAFRYILFGSNGRIDENTGQWNEAEKSFAWKGVGLPDGATRTSTTRHLDGGRVESHIITKTSDGQTQMDLTIKAMPRK